MTTKLIDRLVPSKHSAIFMNWYVITTRPSGSSLADSDRTIGGTLMFPLLESKRASALSARAPRYRCDPTLYNPDMTIGGIDDEPM
jgi:hypothetical protein